jgi:hypothetical protein
MLQCIAGKITALKTELCLPIFKNFAGFDFASDACYRFADNQTSASRAFVFLSQICPANAAIYSAGGDE